MTGCEYIGPTTVPIRGQEGYFISLDCSVWSTHGKSFRQISTYAGKHGYLYTSLNGRKKRAIARLMLSSFVRAPVGNEEADHIDPERITDNTLANLQWLSLADNRAKRRLATGKAHGVNTHPERHAKGFNSVLAKLTKEQVDYCKSKYVFRKYTAKMLAEELNVSRATIENAIHGRTFNK